jgi:type I restriction enzyme S subunit
MTEFVKLSQVAKYSNSRIEASNLTLENFISIDNILPNKEGIKIASGLPPGRSAVPAFEKNNILIGNIRPYLKKIWLANSGGGCSADVLNLEVREGYDPKFIYYALFRDDFFIHMMKGAKGTKMPRGDKSHILEFLIPNFEINLQKKIVQVLSSVDQKIDINRKIIEQLEGLSKTIYGYWFEQFEFPNHSNKPYRSSGGIMTWSEELKRSVPDGWQIGSLLDIAEFQNGLACQRYRPNGGDSLRVIKIKEMNEGFSKNTELVRATVPSKIIIENGDILFSWSASLDVIMWAGGKGALNQHIFKVSSSEYPKFYYYYELVNYLSHFKMMAENRKTTMGHITQEHLQQSRILIPPVDLLKQLEKILEPNLSKIILLKAEIFELSSLRDWILPLLMNQQLQIH